MDYAKKYKKLRKKYHMKNRSGESYAVVYLTLIYLVMIINIGISFYRINKMNIDKMSAFMNVPYIVVVILLSLISFISFYKSKKDKRELLYIILTVIISLAVIPYLFSNIILVVIILCGLVAIWLIKTPVSNEKESKISYQSNEPIVLKYSEDTEFFRKGIMIYKKNKMGEDSICQASAFDHGDVVIIKGNQKINRI